MIRIGTRNSPLAIWQANQVKVQLESLGHICELILQKTNGDQNPTLPIYAMGIQGVFTKTLDSALLDNKIDIAVHSLKDVPTLMPKKVKLAALLKRGSAHDVVVHHPDFKRWGSHDFIGSGSLRRKAQWLRKNPDHKIENLRGNLKTRLEKLNSSNWSGAIFASAGLERMGLLKSNHERLDWMIPAPAQGIIGITTLKQNKNINTILKNIHCKETEICAEIERSFLNTLEGGCTSPIGAHASISDNTIRFEGGLFSPDGVSAIIHKKEIPTNEAKGYGIKAAQLMIEQGGKKIIKQIKSQL